MKSENSVLFWFHAETKQNRTWDQYLWDEIKSSWDRTSHSDSLISLTEYQNQILKHYFKYYCNYQQNDWAEWLFITEFAYNNVIHFFIKITFFFVLYKQHFCMSLNVENDVFKEKINAANQ